MGKPNANGKPTLTVPAWRCLQLQLHSTAGLFPTHCDATQAPRLRAWSQRRTPQRRYRTTSTRCFLRTQDTEREALAFTPPRAVAALASSHSLLLRLASCSSAGIEPAVLSRPIHFRYRGQYVSVRWNGGPKGDCEGGTGKVPAAFASINDSVRCLARARIVLSISFYLLIMRIVARVLSAAAASSMSMLSRQASMVRRTR